MDMTQPYNSTEHVSFNPVQYVPLQKKCFDSITIQLINDFGELMLFVCCKSLLVVKFIRTVHPYHVL